MQLLDFTFPFPVRNPFRPSSSSSLHYLLKAVFMAFPFDSVPKLKTLFQDFIFLFLVFPLCFAVAHPKVPRFSSWVGKIRWRRDRVPTPVFWPGECHGPYGPWGQKESDTTEQLLGGKELDTTEQLSLSSRSNFLKRECAQENWSPRKSNNVSPVLLFD